tara:strand:- start:243 stop:755 length:513 start_codon:yes stop_codon:yes gene_type:complete
MTSYGEKLPSLISRRKTFDRFESDLLTFTSVVGTVFIIGMGIIGWQRGQLFGLLVSLFFGVFCVVFLSEVIQQYSRRQQKKVWQDYEQAYIDTQPFLIKKVIGDIMEEGGREVVDDAPTLAEAVDKAQQLHKSTGETYEIEHHQGVVNAYTQDGKLFETWVNNKLVKQHA